MKILNPQEWLKDKESLMLYGELELEELVSVYGKKYLPDYPLGVIDSVAVQEEWFGFKIVVDSNYQDLAIDDLFPLLYDNYLDKEKKEELHLNMYSFLYDCIELNNK
nr:7434_t:CDS:2 [Entrophospora candida]